jgi:hypothetical protein
VISSARGATTGAVALMVAMVSGLIWAGSPIVSAAVVTLALFMHGRPHDPHVVTLFMWMRTKESRRDDARSAMMLSTVVGLGQWLVLLLCAVVSTDSLGRRPAGRSSAACCMACCLISFIRPVFMVFSYGGHLLQSHTLRFTCRNKPNIGRLWASPACFRAFSPSFVTLLWPGGKGVAAR